MPHEGGKMRVLVTGGAGYIGSVVTDRLIDGGYAVTVYDDLSTGFRDAVNPRATFVYGDVLDVATLAATLRSQRITAIVHMAGRIAVAESMAQPSLYFRTNLGGGLAVLDAMLEASVSRIVFSSTAAVYGNPEHTPIREDAPLVPTSAYGETKLAFERALHWYAEAYGIRSIRLRYFNAAGATSRRGERHSPETHLVPNVLKVASGELPAVTIFGGDYPTRDGTCMRDYVHVEDLAEAHLLALKALDEDHRGAVFNLGCGGDGYSVLDVVRAARSVTGRAVPVTWAPRRAGDPAVLIASSDEIRRQLGWRPRFDDIGAIVASAWAWMQHDADLVHASL
jgi:UDP-glucose 4-epimerase